MDKCDEEPVSITPVRTPVSSDTSPPESRCTTPTQHRQEVVQPDHIPDRKTLATPGSLDRCTTPTQRDVQPDGMPEQSPQVSGGLPRSTLADTTREHLLRLETRCIECQNAVKTAGSLVRPVEVKEVFMRYEELIRWHLAFIKVSHLPYASESRSLVSELDLPARMWRRAVGPAIVFFCTKQGIVLLPNFLDFVTDSLMSFAKEEPLKRVWPEMLGDVTRYPMDMLHCNIQDLETRVSYNSLAEASREYYTKASDISPSVGRLYHHLAVIAGSNTLWRLVCLMKAFCVPEPFPAAGETAIFLLAKDITPQPSQIDAFVKVHCILFSGRWKDELQGSIDKFLECLNDQIAQSQEGWLQPGYFIGIALGCSLLGYGHKMNFLMRALSPSDETDSEVSPRESFEHALSFTVRTVEIVIQRWKDSNALPFLHTIMVLLCRVTRIPAPTIHEAFPWNLIARMLNTLLNSCDAGYEVTVDFPGRVMEQPLPEDFVMRELVYARDYFPDDWFKHNKLGAKERLIEGSSMARRRKQRILHLGCKIAHQNEWLKWDSTGREILVVDGNGESGMDVELQGLTLV